MKCLVFVFSRHLQRHLSMADKADWQTLKTRRKQRPRLRTLRTSRTPYQGQKYSWYYVVQIEGQTSSVKMSSSRSRTETSDYRDGRNDRRSSSSRRSDRRDHDRGDRGCVLFYSFEWIYLMLFLPSILIFLHPYSAKSHYKIIFSHQSSNFHTFTWKKRGAEWTAPFLTSPQSEESVVLFSFVTLQSLASVASTKSSLKWSWTTSSGTRWPGGGFLPQMDLCRHIPQR